MKILILGDTRDAACLASKIATTSTRKVVAAGALDHENADQLTDYFTRVRADIVVDATDRFDVAISHAAGKACRKLGLGHLMMSHSPWRAEKGDIWSEVGSFSAAADALTPTYARIYLKVDARNLAAFGDLPPRRGWFLVRRDEGALTELPLRNCGIVVDGNDPTVESERALLESYRIKRLICENAGGTFDYPALIAARELQVPVIMVRPPPLPDGECAEDIDAALAWLDAKSGASPPEVPA